MNIVEVYIAGLKLDLKEEDTVALTKQINDIAEIQKRQADYTNRFLCKRTPNNMAIAEMLNVPGNTSTRPYKWAAARIVSNGIAVTNYGIALLQETKNREEYEYIIYAGNYDLFSKIDGKYITDLDWSDLLHVFTSDNWIGSWGNTDGYIYPIAETLDGKFKTVQTGGDIVDIRYQVPHVFVKTIWQRIFDEAGLEYHGTFFSTDTNFINELVVADANVFDSDTFHYTNIDNTALNYGTSIIGNYTVLKTGKYVIKMDSDIYLTRHGGADFVIKRNGLIIFEYNIESAECSLSPYRNYSANAEWYQEFFNGDVIEVSIRVVGNGSCGFPSLGIYYTNSYSVDIQIGSAYLFNDNIDFSSYLPKILQVDFLKAIMQQYGLLYQLNNDGRYEFIRIEDLLNGESGINDLSSKYHKETSETYRIGSYGITNLFKYKYYDKDLRGEVYANASFLTNIDNLENENTVIDSIIEACGDYQVLQVAGKIAAIHSYEKQSDDKYHLRLNDKLKTVILNKSNGFELTFYDSDVHIYGQSYTSWVIPYVKFTPLHWQNLLNLYYPKFILMIQKPVKKKVLIWFTPIDIYFLDMFKIIYLKQYQSFFYLNKINNFLPGKLSDTEIIKIN